MANDQKPVMLFERVEDWAEWLEAHPDHPGVRLNMRKKASTAPGITYGEALESALCFGWIDGQINRFDEDYSLQVFTPRRPRRRHSPGSARKRASGSSSGSAASSARRRANARSTATSRLSREATHLSDVEAREPVVRTQYPQGYTGAIPTERMRTHVLCHHLPPVRQDHLDRMRSARRPGHASRAPESALPGA